MIYFILFLVSSILKWVLSPFLYIYGLFRSISLNEFSQFNKELAVANDQFGNCIGKYTFNDLFVKKGGFEYGSSPDETISSVTGKNYQANTLTSFGLIFANTLDKFQKDHVIKSIEKDEADKIK